MGSLLFVSAAALCRTLRALLSSGRCQHLITLIDWLGHLQQILDGWVHLQTERIIEKCEN